MSWTIGQSSKEGDKTVEYRSDVAPNQKKWKSKQTWKKKRLMPLLRFQMDLSGGYFVGKLEVLLRYPNKLLIKT